MLLLSGASLAALLLVALLLPVPFIRLAPGPTFNVIGDIDGKPVILIDGTTTYPTSGQLDMTTVLESGGPRGGLTFISALSSWFNSADAVVPRELIYPDDVSGDQVNAELAKNGVPFDIGMIKPENLEDLVNHLNDLQVDVDSSEAKVRVFCE